MQGWGRSNGICRAAVIAAVSMLATAPACGAIITLSQFSSNTTDPAVLDATLEFLLSSNDLADSPTLTFRATNNTTSPDLYNINELYFNLPDWRDITSITLESIDGDPNDTSWFQTANSTVNGFGDFDVGVVDGVTPVNVIIPTQTKVFEFTLTGTGSIFDTDFTDPNNLSVDDGFDPVIPTVVAGRFIQGPGGDSAYGATIPEPATLVLLALGGLAVMRRRR